MAKIESQLVTIAKKVYDKIDTKDKVIGILTFVLLKGIQYGLDPHGFWGIEDIPTLKQQIASGQSRTDDELSRVYRCDSCGHDTHDRPKLVRHFPPEEP